MSATQSWFGPLAVKSRSTRPGAGRSSFPRTVVLVHLRRFTLGGPVPVMMIGIAYDQDIGEWSVGHNGASTGVPSGLEGPTFVAVVGSIIEFGIPLSLIGNPSGFTEVRAEALPTGAQESDEVGQACVSS